MQQFKQCFLPAINSREGTTNASRRQDQLVLSNQDLFIPFVSTNFVEKLPQVSFPTTCNNLSDSNRKPFKLKFNIYLKSSQKTLIAAITLSAQPSQFKRNSQYFLHIYFVVVLFITLYSILQGWEFAYRFSERIARFLRKNQRMSDSLKKMSLYK